MSQLLARSSSNRTTLWYRHRFSWLARDQAAAYEAVTSDPTTDATGLVVSAKEGGFDWRHSGGEDIKIEGWLGTQRIRWGNFPCSGSMTWGDCRDFDAVDLTLGNPEAGDMEVVRLRVPRSGSTVEFEQVGPHVLIRGHGVSASEIHILHRVQRSNWYRECSGGWISGTVIQIEIPQYQGAFAIVGKSGWLESCQCFGFGELRQADPKDIDEIRQLYADAACRGSSLDSWPQWVRVGLMDPILSAAVAFGIVVDEKEPLAAMRLAVRRLLFGSCLTAAECALDLNLPIEQFAALRWPELAPLIRARVSPTVLAEVFEWRNHHRLVQALEWAGDQYEAVGRCLRLVPLRLKLQEIGPELMTDPHLREKYDTLGQLFDDVLLQPAAEVDVLNAWEEFKKAFLRELGVDPLAMNPDTAADIRFRECLREIRTGADRLPTSSLAEAARGLVENLQRSAEYADLVDRLVARDILDADFGDRVVVSTNEFQGRLDILVHLMPKRFEVAEPGIASRLRSCAANAAAARGAAVEALASEFVPEVCRYLSDLGRQAGRSSGWNQAMAIPLPELVRSAICDVDEYRKLVLDQQQKQRDVESARGFLPPGIDPESDDAQRLATEGLQIAVARIQGLLNCDPEFISSERTMLREALLEFNQALSGGGDKLSEVVRSGQVRNKWAGPFKELEKQLLMKMVVKGRVEEVDLLPLFQDGDYKGAVALAKLGRKIRNYFDAIGSLLWVEPESGLSKIERELASPLHVQTNSDIAKVEARFKEARALVDAKGGVAEYLDTLNGVLNDRMRNLQAEFPQQNLPALPSGLDRLIRAAGAETRGPRGGQLTVDPFSLEGVDREGLQRLLKKHGLWPGFELGRAAHG